jgi:hypothetical protein
MVSGRQRLVGVATIGALGACCLAAAGCGGSTSSGPPDPLANQTGAQVLAKAYADLRAAPSLTLNGTGIASGVHEYVTTYTGIVVGKGCTGTMMQGPLGADGSYTYITIGSTVYLKPDDLMWHNLAGNSAARVIQLVDGRYVKNPPPGITLPGLGSCIVTKTKPNAVPGPIAKDQVTTLDGIRVVPLKDSRGNVIYVTDTSKPEIVQEDTAPVAGTTNPADEYTFSVGAPVKLTPPPADQVVDGATIGL